MGWILRRKVWDDGKYSIDPEDYEVIEDGKAIAYTAPWQLGQR